jgi:hypothetical protein
VIQIIRANPTPAVAVAITIVARKSDWLIFADDLFVVPAELLLILNNMIHKELYQKVLGFYYTIFGFIQTINLHAKSEQLKKRRLKIADPRYLHKEESQSKLLE